MTPEWGRAVEPFLEATAEVAAEDLVTLDEAGVNLGMTPSRERAYAVKATDRGVNTTTLGAAGGVTATMVVEGVVSREAFEVFVGEVLCPTLRAGQVVVMDNLKMHKGDGVRRLIEATGARVVFLPPYSPELIRLSCVGRRSRRSFAGARRERWRRWRRR